MQKGRNLYNWLRLIVWITAPALAIPAHEDS